MPKAQPNILLIVTDHQLHYRHGWDGGQGPLRPCFEALGVEGTTFDRAYCAAPLCGPARRSLLTGMYPHNHRNIHNQSESDYHHTTYLDTLHGLGYHNYYFGKWHAGPGTALDHHCEGLSPAFYGNPYITPEYAAYVERLGLPKATHRIDKLFWHGDTKTGFPQLIEGATGYRCDRSWCGETALGITETPKETHECFFLADLACRQLDALAAQPDRGPFHLRVDFWGPHQPYFPTQEYVDLYDPTQIREYGNFRDDLTNKPATYRHMNRPIADEQGNLIVPSIFSWNEWRAMLVQAYAQSTMVDDAAGRIIEKLDDLGFKDDTLVIYTSDHGDALASHGGMFDKGSFMTEETVRIPLAIRYPAFASGGNHTQALVNTIDLAPTLLAAAGRDVFAQVDGENLLPLLQDPQATLRESLLLESYGQGYRDKLKARTVVTARYKYTINEHDLDELYDLESDPYELDNLAQHPAHLQLHAELAAELKNLMDRYHDHDMIVATGFDK